MSLSTTPLDSLHKELGAKMVPFAGYSMPVQYPSGIIKEHLHTRQSAGLFDVSHMGQMIIEGADIASALESIVPADLHGLAIGGQTYTVFTNESGGVLDDLIVTRLAQDQFFLVVNAACKERDIAHIRANLGIDQSMTVMADQALLALQGPAAREVMRQLCPETAQLVFMTGCKAKLEGVDAYITCSGYTGEDGFEVSMPASHAEVFARRLLAYSEVAPIGLGARDSLRLESGLCLYGHELGASINPVQAGLLWSINKVRRAGGERAGGFPGAEPIFHAITHSTALRRVGLCVEGKRPVRESQKVLTEDGRIIGEICSAGFGASLGRPIAMAYINREHGEPGTHLAVDVRGKLVSVVVTSMPFIAQCYFRG